MMVLLLVSGGVEDVSSFALFSCACVLLVCRGERRRCDLRLWGGRVGYCILLAGYEGLVWCERIFTAHNCSSCPRAKHAWNVLLQLKIGSRQAKYILFSVHFHTLIPPAPSCSKRPIESFLLPSCSLYQESVSYSPLCPATNLSPTTFQENCPSKTNHLLSKNVTTPVRFEPTTSAGCHPTPAGSLSRERERAGGRGDIAAARYHCAMESRLYIRGSYS